MMIDILLAVLCALTGYLLGNFHTSVILSRLCYHDDVRRHGSHNAGTTNMLRVFGLKPGAITFAGDMIKGVLSAFIGTLIFGRLGGAICGLCCVIGHDYPVFFAFHGGKGVATTIGAAWFICPLGGAVVSVCEVLGILVFRRVSVASMLAVFMLAVAMAFIDIQLFPMFIILFVLVMIRHIENIKRLISGTEPTFGQKPPQEPKEL